jgi:hypothetical protein
MSIRPLEELDAPSEPGAYAALIGFVPGLGWLGVTGFRRRVLA